MKPGLMTIFVTWQLIVTLDSIRNSCDVLHLVWSAFVISSAITTALKVARGARILGKESIKEQKQKFWKWDQV